MKGPIFFVWPCLKVICKGSHFKSKQAYLIGPRLSEQTYFSSTMNYSLRALGFCSQPSVSGVLLHHGETTGVVRGSSQSLFWVGQCEVCAAIAHPQQPALGRGSAPPLNWRFPNPPSYSRPAGPGPAHRASRSNTPQTEDVRASLWSLRFPPPLRQLPHCSSARPLSPHSPAARLPEHTSPRWFPFSHPAAPDAPSLG